MNYAQALAARDELLGRGPVTFGADSLPRAGRLSFGVGHRPDGTFGLAIRVQERTSDSDSEIETIVSDAGEENVDVRVTGPIRALGPRDINRPLVIGSSCAHRRVGSGTLGCFVEKNGRMFVLSNNHVLARTNRAAVGDAVLQPAFDDHPASELVVARYAERVDLRSPGTNTVDAAIAEVDPTIACDVRTLPDFGAVRPPSGGVATGRMHKVGRATDLTHGSISASGLIPIAVSINGTAYDFVDQIEISSAGAPFSSDGDSGSVVFGDDGTVVGLLFAGNGTTISYANPIATVFSQLGVQLAT